MGKMKAVAANIDGAEAALILFGLDEAKKPHAAWFKSADAELAERAAGLMRLRALRVVTDEHRAIALELAAGRIFESGRGFAVREGCRLRAPECLQRRVRPARS